MLYFGACSLLRRRFKPKNADQKFSQSQKTLISPYKTDQGQGRFRAEFVAALVQK